MDRNNFLTKAGRSCLLGVATLNSFTKSFGGEFLFKEHFGGSTNMSSAARLAMSFWKALTK
jgi:hypothetical protein